MVDELYELILGEKGFVVEVRCDYIFDEENYQLIGEGTGRCFVLGQKIDIIVAAADPVTRKIDFVLKEWKEAMTWQSLKELS